MKNTLDSLKNKVNSQKGQKSFYSLKGGLNIRQLENNGDGCTNSGNCTNSVNDKNCHNTGTCG